MRKSICGALVSSYEKNQKIKKSFVIRIAYLPFSSPQQLCSHQPNYYYYQVYNLGQLGGPADVAVGGGGGCLVMSLESLVVNLL